MIKMRTILLIAWLPFVGMAQNRSEPENLTVYFDFDRYDLNENALQTLRLWEAANDSVEVSEIYGYCDWTGTNAYNDSLSVRRIRTVYEYLRAHKIKVSENYQRRGFGEDFDQSKNQSENRKVTLTYFKFTPVPKSVAGPFQSKVRTAKTGDLIRLENINFFNMSPRILPKSKPVLNDLLCALEENPKLRIEIQGHICCQTGADYFDVSVARARAIYTYLLQHKISRKRLSFKGFGVTRPIHPIPEKNEQEQEDNRRVEILILEN